MTQSKERHRLYTKLWARVQNARTPQEQEQRYQEFRVEFSEKKLPSPERIRRLKERRKFFNMVHRKKNREYYKSIIAKHFPETCTICNRIIGKMALHRKSGEKHWSISTDIRLIRSLDARPEEWVRLCYPCHKSVHWCMERLGLDWNSIWAMLKRV